MFALHPNLGAAITAAWKCQLLSQDHNETFVIALRMGERITLQDATKW
jgi:hypothetical protein